MTSTPDDSVSQSPGRPGGAPPPLVVAASLVGVEAVVLLLQGVAELFSVSGERAVMGVTTALFFVVYAAGLGVCAVAVRGLRSWARAPIVVAQLIQLLVAWSFRGGATTWVAVSLAAVAVVVLVGVFHPASIEALADEEA